MSKLRLICSLAAISLLTPMLPAQAPPTPVANHVLVMLTVKPGIDRQQITKMLPEEVKATVRLYLDGKIEQWYARTDGKGVVFVLNCGTADEAQAMMDTLPFGKAHVADYAFTPIGPLTPLRLLAGPAPTAP